MKCVISLLQASALIGPALAGCIDSPVQSTSACNITSLAALGDSYSAGLQPSGKEILPLCPQGQYGGFYPPQCTNITCARDTSSYGYQFAQQQGILTGDFGYIACSGANTTNITVQANYILNPPDLITLNLGGDNDNAFASVVKACIYERFFNHNCSAALDAANKTIINIQPYLTSTLDKIRTRFPFPRSAIAVLSYARFYAYGSSFSHKHCQFFVGDADATEMARFNQLVLDLNKQLATAAAAANAYYVDADSGFEGYRFCQSSKATPYFNYHISLRRGGYHQGVFHPTVDGQLAYLSALNKALGCGLGTMMEKEVEEMPWLEVQNEL